MLQALQVWFTLQLTSVDDQTYYYFYCNSAETWISKKKMLHQEKVAYDPGKSFMKCNYFKLLNIIKFYTM